LDFNIFGMCILETTSHQISFQFLPQPMSVSAQGRSQTGSRGCSAPLLRFFSTGTKRSP